MTIELILVLGLLGVVIVMFAIDWPRMDVAALIALCVLPFTGVISISDALAGFSDPNIVLIAALFVIGDGLVRTGVASWLGDWLVRQAAGNQAWLTAMLMLVVCGLGAFMSSTAVTAIFIPVVLRICQRTGFQARQLMMPLSVAALISGMMTLVATAPNLVVNSELVRRGKAGFGFFSFTPIGLPILALSILFMLAARRWLAAPAPSTPSSTRPGRPTLADWIDRYELISHEYRLRIAPDSPLIGKTLDAIQLRSHDNANLIAIQRGHHLFSPAARTQLCSGDILYVDLFASGASIDALRLKYRLEKLHLAARHFVDHSQEIGMAEMFLPADSRLIGKTITSAEIRTRFGFTVVGLLRGLQAIKRDLAEEVLKAGDTLLVIGLWKAIRNAQALGEGDIALLRMPIESDDHLPAPRKLPHSLVALAATVFLMVSGLIPNVHAALLGCLLMGALGCVNIESAYRSIDWKTIILIVGMLPFSTALARTGGVDLASQGLLFVTQHAGPYAILATIFAATAILGLFISNTATAVLMAPVALTIADSLDASPYPFAMIVALASSSAFMTPVSSPVNTLVVTPGRYRFIDFVKIGAPLTLIVLLVSVLLVPWLLPLK